MWNVSLQVSLRGQSLTLKWAENQASKNGGFFLEKKMSKKYFFVILMFKNWAESSELKRLERTSAQVWDFFGQF